MTNNAKQRSIVLPTKLQEKVATMTEELQKIEEARTIKVRELNSLIEGFLANFDVAEDEHVAFNSDRTELIITDPKAETPVMPIGQVKEDEKPTEGPKKKEVKN